MKSIDIASIDLNLLVAFEALFEEQSVTAAAQRLHLGQPAMSASLSRLRQLFDDELFIRVGREMKPTTKALEIVPGISLALRQIRQTLEASQTFDPVRSQRVMAIGSSDYTSSILLPKLLDRCRDAPGIDFRLVNYEKDEIEDLLEQRVIDVAIGTFQSLPRQAYQLPLMQERFVGICRKGHPAWHNGISLDTFVSVSHALFTLRQDAIGEIDKALTQHQLQRRIALTTPYLLVLPSIIAASDLVAAIPSRLAHQFAQQGLVELFELPIPTEPWLISMIWSKLVEQDQANRWLRQEIEHCCRGL
jgi:DNA-binding transcriptional LysR family regulator